MRRERTKAHFQYRGKRLSLRQALNRSASKGASLGRALWIEKRETLSGPAARKGEVVERMICDTCSEETLENIKMGREGRGKSRAVARSAAKQAEEAQDTETKNEFNSSAVKKLSGDIHEGRTKPRLDSSRHNLLRSLKPLSLSRQ